MNSNTEGKASAHTANQAQLEQCLRHAIERVRIANAEGNPILSAWLPEATALLGTPPVGFKVAEGADVVRPLSTKEPKVYRVEVRGGGDLDNTPGIAVFQVSEESARNIVKLSGVVKANDLYKVERFDYRADFLQYDPEVNPDDAEEAGEENSVRTDCDVLVVTDAEFFFRAYVKHTDVSVECEAQSIAALAAHFGISSEESEAEGR
ncbi:hypothetical protein [Paraburkholderia fungorum]|uniref:hypothetical protein n=1 Tax=Paraburkholderia fungorum TaxID=134537 RepID=UPI001614991C